MESGTTASSLSCKRAPFGQRLGHGFRFPLLAVDEGAQPVLQCRVAQGRRLAEQELEVRRQAAASVHGAHHRVCQVVDVNERLAMRGFAGEDPALELAFVDPADLVRQRRRLDDLAVNPGDAQQHTGNGAVLVRDDAFRFQLGLGIHPARFGGRGFVDRHPGFGGRMDQHGGRVDELFDLECLQLAQEAAGPLDIDLLVQRVGLAAEIEVAGEVHHRGDPRAIT
jgi:hypothetical protein